MSNRIIFDSLKRHVNSCTLNNEKLIKHRRAIEKFQKKAVRVAVLGGDTPIGESLAMLLKINPLVSHLYLQGDNCRGLSIDLNHIDTRTMVSGFYENDVDKAIRRAEIIVILPVAKYSERFTTAFDRFRSEYERLIKVTRFCTLYAPRSIVYVCVPPISMSVPLVSEVFKKTHWYHPGKIIGSVAGFQVKLNSRLASFDDLDPAGVNVPIVGGPDQDCIVPMFSRAMPLECEADEAECLTKEIKGIPKEEKLLFDINKMQYIESSPLSNAFGINRSITTMALGIIGDERSVMTGFIRTNILRNTCRYLVSTIKLGPHGVFHNYGLPLLTSDELKLVEKAALLLSEREKLAIQMLETADEKKIAKSN